MALRNDLARAHVNSNRSAFSTRRETNIQEVQSTRIPWLKYSAHQINQYKSGSCLKDPRYSHCIEVLLLGGGCGGALVVRGNWFFSPLFPVILIHRRSFFVMVNITLSETSVQQRQTSTQKQRRRAPKLSPRGHRCGMVQFRNRDS